MPVLATPHTGVHASFLAAMAEFAAEGRGGPDDGSSLGDDIRSRADRWHQPEAFAGYVRDLLAERGPVQPPGKVPCTTLWWVDGDDFLGRLAIRHVLTPSLLVYGGHIGYDVRPSARRRGHATAMLAAALPIARDLGIDRALLTCDAANAISRRVIEGAGGVYEDQRGTQLRFWVPTG